ncbi:hypothetical protein GCM10009841_31640 [Microlunatus panaciterrae]|uniref:Uncharacterized protein YjbI with pentapeptide repeats n=1 Tax=Microlunatus panaciterrae TaxID=400768 RepID=A0ABS2RFS9_9ACTN|nr:pentapeptide repeat-containing protein [Microlunatus panaciterrae]MBM7797822.1 uncharacterized protein YjbI with pentapeptide repeats [Microlunatus panaciterrae]
MERKWILGLGLGLAAVAVALLGVVIGLAWRPTAPATATAGLSSAQLQEEKLRQEIRALEISNAQASGPQHAFLAWAPFITALGAIVAVGATLWKQSSELTAARLQLSDEHEKSRIAQEQWRAEFLEDQRNARSQRDDESLRRFDSNLTSVITNLGSASETLQVNAAAALATYLKPRYAAFHQDLLFVISANLRLRPGEAVVRVLRSDLERLLRLILDRTAVTAGELPSELDLARARLDRLDLSGLDLRGIAVDVAFADLTGARMVGTLLPRLKAREVILEGAHCSRADLGEARLNGAHARGVVMHGTNLVSATLKNADLQGAQFQQARLQEAHFEGAVLVGANFTDADVANAFFWKATFDDAALISIAGGAHRWRENTNFDAATRARLEQLAAPSG